MIIRYDDAFFIDDNARAQARLRHHVGGGAHWAVSKLIEEIKKRIARTVLFVRHLLHRRATSATHGTHLALAAFAALGRLNVDDRWADLCCDPAKTFGGLFKF